MLSGLAGRGVLCAGMRSKLDREYKNEINEGKNLLVTLLKGTSVTLRYLGNDSVDCMHFVSSKHNCPSEATVIYFCGMGDSFERLGYVSYVAESWVFLYLNEGINVFLWNYPHVSNSSGSPSFERVMLAGDTVITEVMHRFNVPEEQIILHGHSMGGGISLYLASQRTRTGELKYKHLNICNDRSFSCLEKAIQWKVPFFGSIVGRVVNNCGWVLKSYENWRVEGTTGHYWCIYHEKDEFIGKDAAMATALHNNDEIGNTIHLDSSNKCYRNNTLIDYAEILQDPSHDRPLFPEEWELQKQHLQLALKRTFPLQEAESSEQLQDL